MEDEEKSLSDEAARALAQKRYLSSDAFRRWSRVRAFQNQRFKSSVDGNKAMFDFVRMVLTTALVIGLAVFIGRTASPDIIGFARVISVWSLAALLLVASWQAAGRFAALVVTTTLIGLLAGYPTGRKGAAGFTAIVLVVSAFTFVAVASVAWEVGAQAAKHVQDERANCEIRT